MCRRPTALFAVYGTHIPIVVASKIIIILLLTLLQNEVHTLGFCNSVSLPRVMGRPNQTSRWRNSNWKKTTILEKKMSRHFSSCWWCVIKWKHLQFQPCFDSSRPAWLSWCKRTASNLQSRTVAKTKGTLVQKRSGGQSDLDSIGQQQMNESLTCKGHWLLLRKRFAEIEPGKKFLHCLSNANYHSARSNRQLSIQNRKGVLKQKLTEGNLPDKLRVGTLSSLH